MTDLGRRLHDEKMIPVTVEDLRPTRRSASRVRPSSDAGVMLAPAVRAMVEARGCARCVQRASENYMIPMVIVDNDRRYLHANRAARLLLRMSLRELRGHRIDDFAPRETATGAGWRVEKGSLTRVPPPAPATSGLPDGRRLPVVYCRLANLLPGRHLSIFAPADWPEGELGAPESGGERPAAGPLSRREREVLSLVATGAGLQQIADELLTISPATVRTHITNAHRKLGTRNRAHAVATAIQQGAIEPPRSPSERDLP